MRLYFFLLGTAEAALERRNSISLRNYSGVFFILNLSRLKEKCQIKKIFAVQDLGKENLHRKKNYLYTGEYPQVIHRHAHGSRGFLCGEVHKNTFSYSNVSIKTYNGIESV